MSAGKSAGAGSLSAAGLVAPQVWHVTELSLVVLALLMIWLAASSLRTD